MNQISQFDTRGQKKKENWFLRTAIQISVLAGAATVYFKMRGPLKDNLSKILKKQIDIIHRRAEFKSSSSKFFGDEPKSRYYTYRDIPEAKPYNSPVRNQYGKTLEERGRLQEMSFREIETKENNLKYEIEHDIRQYNFDPSIPKQTFKTIDIDSFLFEIRKATLSDYVNHHNVIKSEDFDLIQTFKDPKTDKEKLRTLHETYLREDPNYADNYQSKLNNFKHNYIVNRDRLSGNGSNPIISDENFAKSIALEPKIPTTTVDESIAMRLPTRHRTNIITEETLWNMVQGNNKFTSSSLVGELDYIKGDIFKIAGRFDYSQDIKDLISTVRSIDKDKLGIAHIVTSIVQTGSSDSPVFYLRVTMTHIKKRGEFSIDIPLAQNGFLPASNPFGRQRHDFAIPKVFGGVNKLNSDFRNSTQLVIKNITKSLKSSLTNSFMTEPGEVINRMKSAMEFILEPAARLENTTRDATTNMIIINKDRRLENKLLFNRSFEAIDTLRTMARHRNQGGLNITVDLETISPTRTGPNVQATDAHTQITQAGFSVGEIDKTGAYHIRDMENFYSDHAVPIMEKLGYTREQTNWLKEYLPEKDQIQLTDANPEAVGKAWGKYQRSIVSKQGRSFANNHQIAKHLIDQIRAVIKANPEKPIYITTKFGTGFDLKLLGIWAPNEFTALMKDAKHLDIHGVAHLENMTLGSDESISQTQLLKEMMSSTGYDTTNFDLSNKKSIISAITHLQSKGQIVMSTSLLKKIGNYSNMMAHNAGTDAMLLQTLVGFNINKYLSNQKTLDTDYEELRRIFNNVNHHKSIDEMWEDSTNLERMSAFGHVTSSMGLSQGLIAKGFSSLVQTRHFLLFPDVPANKQWNQMLSGGETVLGDKGRNAVEGLGNLAAAKIRRKLLSPSVVSRGELDAVGWWRGANAEKELFSHTLNVRYFAVLGGFGNHEGVHHISADVLEKANLKYTEKLNLSEVASMTEDVNLSQQIKDLYSSIEKRAKEIAAKDGSPHISQWHYDLAASEICKENNPLTKIPKSTKMLASSGSQGSMVFNAPVDGKITNLHVSVKSGNMKVFADTEFIINSQADLPWVMRGMAGKAVAVIDEAVTRGMMYEGVEGYGPASFLEKNYFGSMKTIVMRKGFDEIFDKLENGTPDQKTEARKMIKKWSAKLNMEWNKDINLMIHDSYKDGEFANIKKFENNIINKRWDDANKYIGNIDMNVRNLYSFMQDMGQVWKEEEVRKYYGVFGSTLEQGKINAQKFYENQLLKLKEEFDSPNSEFAKVLQSLDPNTKMVHFGATQKLLKAFLLPGVNDKGNLDISSIAKGNLPKFFEPLRRMQGKGPAIYDIGILFNEAGNIFSHMNGTHGRATQIKLRRSILGQIGDSEHLTPTTRQLLKDARAMNISDKAEGFAKSREKFFNSIFGELTKTKNLTLNEIETILDIKRGLDVKKLKIHDLDPIKKAELLKSLEDINDVNEREIIRDIITTLDSETLAESLLDPKNKTFASLKSAQEIMEISKKKEVYKLSIDPKSNNQNIYEFNLKNLLNMFTDEEKLYNKLPNINILTNIFSNISKKSSDFCEIDAKTGVVKIKNFVLRAPHQVDNVINLVSKADDNKYGYLTHEKIQSDKVLDAFRKFNKNAEEGIEDESGKLLFQKQYLSYLMRQFIDVGEDEITPYGFTAKSIDSNNIFIKLQDFKRRMGGKFDWGQEIGIKTESQQALNEWSERILKNFHMSDVFVHENFYKENMDYNFQENKKIQGKKHWDLIKNKFPNAPKSAQNFIYENSFAGAILRFPISPAGTVPMLESRFNIVPKEIAPYLGINANVMAVQTDFYKWIAGDNDGDLIYGVVHGFDTIKNLQKLHADKDRSFQELLDTDMVHKNEIVKMRDVLKERKFFSGVDVSKGALRIGGFDTIGNLMETEIDIGSEEGIKLLNESYKGLTSSLAGIASHDPSIITSTYVQDRVDQQALTSISKNTIGVFENILTTRKRQILRTDPFRNNNVLQNILKGTQFTGLGALSQAPITLGKHGNAETMHKLSLALKALVDVNHYNKENDDALMEVLKGTLKTQDGKELKVAPLFKTTEQIELFHKALTSDMRDYVKKLGPKEASMFLLEQYSETQELGKNISLIQEMMTRAGEEAFNYADIPKKTINPRLIAFSKHSRTFGAIAGAAYLAANFFKPNQLSNSLNPFDGFTDLGTDIDGNHKSFLADMELDRGIPLDSIAPSFSNKAFIRTQEMIENKYKKSKSNIINSSLLNSFQNTNPLINEWRTPTNLTYTNYNSNIGYFGSSQLDRKARY